MAEASAETRPMTEASAYCFKPATEAWELEAIERLNHDTFTGEIPQHQVRPDGRLRDQFHAENQYFLALHCEEVIGMVALRDQRPFSLDHKLPDLDRHLPFHHSLCEIRLLAVKPDHRHRGVFRGLMEVAAKACRARGHDLAVISGTVRQLPLYRHIGFEPFGPLVGTEEAAYQPMYLRAETFTRNFREYFEPLNFLPGPVPISPAVRQALARPALYHREEVFQQSFQTVREGLCTLAGATRVQVLVGSGTLANECVGGQLSLLEGPGLVLSNGEFGDRLLEQACRWGLNHRACRIPWGEAFKFEDVAAVLEDTCWIWAVHGETSTGVLNDLEAMKRLCASRNLDLALDCVSTLGAVPLNLEGVRFAAATSGKALGAFPGLAMVFHDRLIVPSNRLPRYLDLGLWEASQGVPFTHSSNLLGALAEALKRFEGAGPFAELLDQAHRLRATCAEAGLPMLAAAEQAHPCALTIPLPPAISADAFGRALRDRHLQLAWQSSYLRERNWIQACLMVPHPVEELEALQRGLIETWRSLRS